VCVLLAEANINIAQRGEVFYHKGNTEIASFCEEIMLFHYKHVDG